MGLRFPYLELCCFYFPLKTGVKFFGFSSVVGCLLNAMESAWTIAYYSYHKEKSTKKEDKDEYSWGMVELSVDIVLQLIQVTTSVLLLLAVYQSKPRLIPAWLVTTVIIALAEVIFQPAFPNRMLGVYHYYEKDFFRWFIHTSVLLVDDVYGWLVVLSYYRTLNPQSPNVI